VKAHQVGGEQQQGHLTPASHESHHHHDDDDDEREYCTAVSGDSSERGAAMWKRMEGGLNDRSGSAEWRRRINDVSEATTASPFSEVINSSQLN